MWIGYHASQPWRLLRQQGWSCQRLRPRILERDEEEIRQSKRKRWPEIKKSPQPGGTIAFVDEDGLAGHPPGYHSQQHQHGLGYAQYHLNWKTLAAMAV